MPTRFQNLRQAVANLSAPAEKQVHYLERLFMPLTGGNGTEGYGNDELALELQDIFLTASDMISHGELTEVEREAVRPLDELLEKWSGKQNSDFWRREALFHDARWEEVRSIASCALAQLPDEERAVGRSAVNGR